MLCVIDVDRCGAATDTPRYISSAGPVFGSYTWMVITTALTFGYFISRGIAKASRVLEQ